MYGLKQHSARRGGNDHATDRGACGTDSPLRSGGELRTCVYPPHALSEAVAAAPPDVCARRCDPENRPGEPTRI